MLHNLGTFFFFFFFMGRKNIVGKGENVGNQHFLSFPPQCFQKSFLRVVISQDWVVMN